MRTRFIDDTFHKWEIRKLSIQKVSYVFIPFYKSPNTHTESQIDKCASIEHFFTMDTAAFDL